MKSHDAMSGKALESRTTTIESCSLQLQKWRPFHPPAPDSSPPSKSKRPCRPDRSTSFPIDFSKLTLFDNPPSSFFARKRRRKGSRSVSGVSSDRSGTRRRYCSVNGTCSDFVMAVGTDSSGELFVNGEANWSSDVSDAARNGRREKYVSGVAAPESVNPGFGHPGNFDAQGTESGYGSEPGYRGDAEFADGDEFDEEEDYPKVFFWDHQFAGNVANPKRASENTLQKTHHRGRRKKHDLRMVDPIG